MTTKAHARPSPNSLRKHSVTKKRRSSRARRRRSVWSIGIGVALIVAIAAMLFASRSPRFGEGVGAQAPTFTLPSTGGGSVSLADFRGKDVLLYFSEGVGCDACFYQMQNLEQNATKLSAEGITVVPIVVNPADQVRVELDRFGLRTPFLVDANESVSSSYGVIGTGMHANLPGHSFILVDAAGRIAWSGDYPSMFVTTDQLLSDIGSAR
jgi:peroxiredoxin